MCYKIISDDLFKLEYCHDKYKTQRICNKAADSFLPALEFVLDGLLWSCHCNETGILSIGLDNIDLDDTNYDVDDSGTIINIMLSA